MKDLLRNVVATSIKAGNKILSYYSDKNFTIKDDQSPLTEADIQSNLIIKDELNSFSDYNILSEEGAKVDWEIRKQWSNFWIVDPLDGTKEFLKKNGEFTVNIALIENNIPKLGVIYVPALNTLYYGLSGNGSFKHNIKDIHTKINYFSDLNKISCNNNTLNLTLVASRSHPSKELDDWLLKYNNYKLLDAGSSLKFCLVAEGLADAYPRFVGSSEWDIAAGYIILQEAGGIIVDVDNNNLKFNKQSIRNPFFIASSKLFFKNSNLSIK